MSRGDLSYYTLFRFNCFGFWPRGINFFAVYHLIRTHTNVIFFLFLKLFNRKFRCAWFFYINFLCFFKLLACWILNLISFYIFYLLPFKYKRLFAFFKRLNCRLLRLGSAFKSGSWGWGITIGSNWINYRLCRLLISVYISLKKQRKLI